MVVMSVGRHVGIDGEGRHGQLLQDVLLDLAQLAGQVLRPEDALHEALVLLAGPDELERAPERVFFRLPSARPTAEPFSANPFLCRTIRLSLAMLTCVWTSLHWSMFLCAVPTASLIARAILTIVSTLATGSAIPDEQCNSNLQERRTDGYTRSQSAQMGTYRSKSFDFAGDRSERNL